MRLMILRHGKAERRSVSGRDEDRTLTDRGIRQAAWIGQSFADRRGPAFDRLPERILTSPAKRANQTAQAVSEYLGLHVEGARELFVDEPLSGLLDLLHVYVRQGVAAVLLVGHNPQLERFCQHLSALADSPNASAELRTGELAVFDADLDSNALGRGEIGWPCHEIARVRLDEDDASAEERATRKAAE